MEDLLSKDKKVSGFAVICGVVIAIMERLSILFPAVMKYIMFADGKLTKFPEVSFREF